MGSSVEGLLGWVGLGWIGLVIYTFYFAVSGGFGYSVVSYVVLCSGVNGVIGELISCDAHRRCRLLAGRMSARSSRVFRAAWCV